MSKLKAIFLDRDGVINIDKEYLYKIEDFEFQENIFQILLYLESKGYNLFIVTNQSGIGRGYYHTIDFEKLTIWMLEEFRKKGINISQVEYCPHKPADKCSCRKPNTKMLKNILKIFDIDLGNSWMIGDKKSDMQFAKNGHIGKTIFFNTNQYKENTIEADYQIKNLKEILEII